MSGRNRPVIVQHSFGAPGSGGPATAVGRLLESRLAQDYDLVRMHQDRAVGGLNPALVLRWVGLLRRTRPDVVHVRGLGNEGFHAALAARLAGCPRILLSIHGTVRDLTASGHRVRRGLLATFLEPATLRMATRVVTVCQAMQERAFLDPVRDRMGAAIPNGVEPAVPIPPEARTRLRAGLRLEPDRVVLVSVGRLSIEKGHLELAAALAGCDAEVLARVVLLLVGDGPDQRAILDAYGSVAGLDVRALGRRDDVARILPAGDIFVFPTRHENLSNALIEAMSAGLPAVATAVGGNVEVLATGGGVLVPPGDAEALTEAISALARDDSRRRALGSRAREVVAESYTLERAVADWDRCYRSMLAISTFRR